MHRRRYSLAVALFVLGLALPAGAESAAPAASPAPAESAHADARQEAARRFEHAIKLYEEGDYALALAEFERVYELMPDFRVLYNIGQVSIQLGRYARAYRTLQQYLKQGGENLAGDRVSAVRADLELLTTRTARILVRVDRPGAEVLVDGVAVGMSPLAEPVVVDVGQRRIQVKLDGYRAQTKSLRLAGGDVRESEFALEPDGVKDNQKSALAPVGRPVPERPPSAEDPRRPWLWAGWVASGVLATGAVVSGVLGLSAAGDLDEARASAGTSRAELDAAQSRAEGLLLAADLLGAAALVTGGATLYLQLSSAPKANAGAKPPLGLTLSTNRIIVTLRH